MRKLLLISWLSIISSAIAALFWHNEWKYNLPTPKPENYVIVKPGKIINTNAIPGLNNDKPALLHFFNPACPCSRFNISHFKSLIKKYGDRMNFVVIVMSNKKNLTAQDIRDRFGFKVPVFFDQSIATTCGVYSTPQAVILDKDHKLYYRGNYNKSRYCSDPNSNYAQMAIDSLLLNNYKPVFSEAAVKSYGCSLPSCNK